MGDADPTKTITQGSATYDPADLSEAARRSVSRTDQAAGADEGPNDQADDQRDLTQTDAASTPKA